MINVPFISNSAPDGVRRPVVEISVSGGGNGLGSLGSAAGLADSLLGGGRDFWQEHYIAIALDTGPAPFVDSLRLTYAHLPNSGSAETDIALGDTLSLSLGYADSETAPVFSGTVTRHHHSLNGQSHLYINSGGFALSHLRLNQSYEQQTAGDIAKDLASQASVETDVIESGISLPFYSIGGQNQTYAHIAQLARNSGYWAYFTPKGKLVFAPVQLGDAVQTFTYGTDILSLETQEITPNAQTVVVTGEGAAGAQGQAASNWLVAEPSGVQAQAGSGSASPGGIGDIGSSPSSTQYLNQGALRSQAAVKSLATSQIQAISTPIAAELCIPGSPALTVGSTLSLANLPNSALNGDFLIKRVCHRVSKAQGFITRASIFKPGDANLLPGLASLGGLL